MGTSTILLGLGAATGWGVAGFFDARASRAVSPTTASLLINATVTIGYDLLYLLLFRHHAFSFPGTLYAIASGMTICVGALAYFKGLSLGPVSLVSPLSSTYPLVTTLLAISIFGASLRAGYFIGIIAIVCGVLLASGIFRGLGRMGAGAIEKGPVLGICTALFWGSGYVLLAQAIRLLGWQTASFVELTAMTLSFGICVPLFPWTRMPTWEMLRSGIKNRNIWAAGTLALCAATMFNLGLSKDGGSGAIVTALSSCYPVLTVALSIRHFKESVGMLRLSGSLLSVTGVILLSLAR